jgi:UDPglucose 6-dehydrogenase
VKALLRTAEERGVPLRVLTAVEDANDAQKHLLTRKLTAALPTLQGAKIAVWGLAFKAQTDDMRESAALVLIDELLTAGATVVAHDPEAMHEAKRRLGDRITYADSNYAALDGADALVIVTDWNAYRTPDFTRVKAALKRPVIIDGRNLYEPAKVRALGFTYASIGRR